MVRRSCDRLAIVPQEDAVCPIGAPRAIEAADRHSLHTDESRLTAIERVLAGDIIYDSGCGGRCGKRRPGVVVGCNGVAGGGRDEVQFPSVFSGDLGRMSTQSQSGHKGACKADHKEHLIHVYLSSLCLCVRSDIQWAVRLKQVKPIAPQRAFGHAGCRPRQRTLLWIPRSAACPGHPLTSRVKRR